MRSSSSTGSGAAGINPRTEVAELKPVQRAMVAIARAFDELRRGRGLLILDEVTAFLTQDGIDQLFDLVRERRRPRYRGD